MIRPSAAPRPLSAVSAAEWIHYVWFEVTTMSDKIRMMVCGMEREPDDRARIEDDVRRGRLRFPMPDEPPS